MDIDVALVPSEARTWGSRVCIVIDELRASSTLTTLLDLGCASVVVTRSLADARRLGRERGAVLIGERRGTTPAGFDWNNSPTEVARASIGGRHAVLSTSNGTRVLDELRDAPAALVGCLLNATACAEAAVRIAFDARIGIGIACAGIRGRVALDDAVAAGVIVERIVAVLEQGGEPAVLSDPALAALRLQSAYANVEDALAESASGRLVRALGFGDDVPFCARIDVTTTVPILRPGASLVIEALEIGPNPGPSSAA